MIDDSYLHGASTGNYDALGEQYRFCRDSKLPRSTFHAHHISVDGWVYVACLLIVAGLVLWTRVL